MMNSPIRKRICEKDRMLESDDDDDDKTTIRDHVSVVESESDKTTILDHISVVDVSEEEDVEMTLDELCEYVDALPLVIDSRTVVIHERVIVPKEDVQYHTRLNEIFDNAQIVQLKQEVETLKERNRNLEKHIHSSIQYCDAFNNFCDDMKYNGIFNRETIEVVNECIGQFYTDIDSDGRNMKKYRPCYDLDEPEKILTCYEKAIGDENNKIMGKGLSEYHFLLITKLYKETSDENERMYSFLIDYGLQDEWNERQEKRNLHKT